MFTVIPESIIEEGGSPRTETLLVDAGEMLAEGQPNPPPPMGKRIPSVAGCTGTAQGLQSPGRAAGAQGEACTWPTLTLMQW